MVKPRDEDWADFKRLTESPALSFLNDEELDKDLSKTIDDILVVNDEAQDFMPSMAKAIEKYARAVPAKVPTLLACTPTEFMELPLEHFQKLCGEHGYGRIISSLTYIQNIAGHNDQSIIERVLALKTALKEQRTTPSAESHNIPSGPSAAEDASDNPAST